MLLDYQNTSFEVKDAKPDMAILPMGTTEQYGYHLPVGTTTIILDILARRVAERLKGTVYLLPTMPLGTSGLHMPTPGTIALEWSTLMSVVYDLVESLVAQGIRQVVVINGLGGATETTVRPRENYIVKTTVRQLNYDVPELDAIWVQPFTVAGRDLAEIMESAHQDIHAGELATSLMLHLAPDAVKGTGVDWAPEEGKEYLDYVPFRQLCPGGVWGRPSLASAEKGERALEVAVQRTVEYIEESFAHLATMKRRVYY
ncbi:MAG: creatininase family protein [Anaerolineales bacterium]|nr:creatininase family protein [Anaerolineales bacterium]